MNPLPVRLAESLCAHAIPHVTQHALPTAEIQVTAETSVISLWPMGPKVVTIKVILASKVSATSFTKRSPYIMDQFLMTDHIAIISEQCLTEGTW
jgi:hypothetical protein